VALSLLRQKQPSATALQMRVSFGRYIVSNPDLPKRIEEGLSLSEYDRNTFYTFDARG
jgi:2,4-dienoyl-CoA reductase-like NADH-dependent reductase (Old Yellow Enzyme family)